MRTSYSSQKDEHDGKTTDPNRGAKYREYVCEVAVSVPCRPRSYCHYNFMEKKVQDEQAGYKFIMFCKVRTFPDTQSKCE